MEAVNLVLCRLTQVQVHQFPRIGACLLAVRAVVVGQPLLQLRLALLARLLSQLLVVELLPQVHDPVLGRVQ